CRHAADYDPHAARIRHDGDGSNLQSGREVALHVWRPIQGTDDATNDHRPRLGPRSATFPELACLVCACSRAQGRHALYAARRQRPAYRQNGGRQPGGVLEHRWLHNIHGPVPEGHYTVPLGEPRVVTEGADVTIVAASYATLDAMKAGR